MLRFARIALVTIVVTIGVGLVEHALDLQGVAGGLGDIGFLVVTMILASFSDRQLFWAAPPKPQHRR